MGFAKGMWTVLFGEVVAAAAVLAWSPKAREAARPYLVRGIRSALEIRDELSGMVEEARREGERIAEEIASADIGVPAARRRSLDEFAGAGTRTAR